MEDDQNGRRPKWKTIKMEGDQNGSSASLLGYKSDARHYEIPEFDNEALALELVDNKLDQHSFVRIFIPIRIHEIETYEFILQNKY